MCATKKAGVEQRTDACTRATDDQQTTQLIKSNPDELINVRHKGSLASNRERTLVLERRTTNRRRSRIQPGRVDRCVPQRKSGVEQWPEITRGCRQYHITRLRRPRDGTRSCQQDVTHHKKLDFARLNSSSNEPIILEPDGLSKTWVGRINRLFISELIIIVAYSTVCTFMCLCKYMNVSTKRVWMF